MRNLFSGRFIIVTAICVTLIGTPAVPAVAQTSSREQQINALSATLVTIGDTIRTAASLSEAERLSLYTQLVSISNAIVALRNADGQSDVPGEEEEVTDFIRALLAYDYKKPNEVVVTTYYASSSAQTKKVNYSELSNYTTFAQKMSAVRKFGAYDISELVNLPQTEVRRLTHITGRNPARGDGVIKNSQDAYKLTEDFGITSVINSVNLFPGDGIFTLQISSDQNETATFEISENDRGSDPRETINQKPRYTYHYTFRLTDPKDIIWVFGRDEDPEILVEDTNTAMEKDEIIDLIVSLFGKHPLAKEIESYNDKIFQFLMNNKSYLFASERAYYRPEDRNCYDEADVAVMTELAGSLLTTMKVQHDSVVELFSLQAPVLSNDGGTSKECRNIKQVF